MRDGRSPSDMGARRLRRLTAALFVALLCGTLGCTLPSPASKPWIEVRSENFTITSSMNEAKTVALIQEMEFFRAAVLGLTRVKSVESSVPTRIYAFDSRTAFRKFGHENAAGYIVPNLRGFYVGLQGSSAMDASLILKHEYVHFLLRNRTKLLYPRWFDEGFAEFMSTLSIIKDYAVVGAVPKYRTRQFQHGVWVPMKRVLEYDGSRRWTEVDVGMFYAQSWALIQYLLHDEQGRRDFPTIIGRYLELTREGSTASEAGELAFGMPLRKLDKELQTYLQRGRFEPFGVKASALEWSTETTARSISQALVAERLGDLALQGGKIDVAGRFFAEALALDPDRPRAHAGMGDVLKIDKQWEKAESHFLRALELDEDDPLNQLDIGEYWHSRAANTDDPDRRRNMLKQARRHYVKAYQLDDSRPEPYYVYGDSFLLNGEDASEGIETLEHAANLLPGNLQILYSLANAYAKLNRNDEARELLTQIISWGHGGGYATMAHTLLEELDVDESNSGDTSDP